MNRSWKLVGMVLGAATVALLLAIAVFVPARWTQQRPAAQISPGRAPSSAPTSSPGQSPLPTPTNASPPRPAWTAQDLRVISDEPFKITAFPVENSEKIDGPVWSPDGQVVILNRFLGAEQISATEMLPRRELWAIRLDGTGEMIAENALLPQWSPDGTKIAYLQRPGNVRDYSLWMADWPSNQKHKLADAVGLWNPSWLRNHTIVFPTQQGRLMSMDVADQKMAPIAGPQVFADLSQGATAIASPDGAWIVVRTPENRDKLTLTPMQGQGKPWIVPSSEGTVFSFIIGPIAWSPDGSRLAFTAGGYSLNEPIHVVELDSRHERDISVYDIANATAPRSLTWSPDGQVLAFVARNENTRKTNLFIVNADGTYMRNISIDENLFVRTPAWSPDGTHILYSEFTDQDARPRPRLLTIAPD